MKKSVLAVALACVLTTIPFTGCSSQSSSSNTAAKEKVSFRLNYYASGLHAPFYVALEKGYYANEGLDVKIGEGTGGGTTAKLVGNKSDTFGFVDAGTVASSVSQGISIKVVAPIYAVNAFAVIARSDSGIKTVKDLEGKKVGITTGDAPSQLFDAVVKANKIDKSKIKLVSMDSAAKVSALANKQVDAVLGGADAQAIQLKSMGIEPTVLRYSENGVPTIGLSVVTSSDLIKSNPQQVKKFVEATLKGWDYARSHEDEAIQIEQKYVPTIKEGQAKQELEVALSSLFAKDSKGIGDVSSDDWKTCISLLQSYAGVDKSLSADSFYSTDGLPSTFPAK